MSQNKPFNYSGSKLFLVDIIAKLIDENLPNYKVYVEPFLGSGAVFYNIPFKETADYIISDKDEYIFRMHNSFKQENSYKHYLKAWEIINSKFGDIKNSKEAYYAFRDAWNKKYNKTTSEKDYYISGLYLLILASSCINSMLRFGPNGMNQSYGRRSKILTKKEYNQFAQKICHKNTHLRNIDFYDLFDTLIGEKNDPEINLDNLVMFLDPPYATREMTYNMGFDLAEFIHAIKYPKNYPEHCLIMYTDKDNKTSDILLEYGWEKQKIRDMVSTSPNRKEGIENTGDEVMFILKK